MLMLTLVDPVIEPLLRVDTLAIRLADATADELRNADLAPLGLVTTLALSRIDAQCEDDGEGVEACEPVAKPLALPATEVVADAQAVALNIGDALDAPDAQPLIDMVPKAVADADDETVEARENVLLAVAAALAVEQLEIVTVEEWQRDARGDAEREPETLSVKPLEGDATDGVALEELAALADFTDGDAVEVLDTGPETVAVELALTTAVLDARPVAVRSAEAVGDSDRVAEALEDEVGEVVEHGDTEDVRDNAAETDGAFDALLVPEIFALPVARAEAVSGAVRVSVAENVPARDALFAGDGDRGADGVAVEETVAVALPLVLIPLLLVEVAQLEGKELTEGEPVLVPLEEAHGELVPAAFDGEAVAVEVMLARLLLLPVVVALEAGDAVGQALADDEPEELLDKRALREDDELAVTLRVLRLEGDDDGEEDTTPDWVAESEPLEQADAVDDAV